MNDCLLVLELSTAVFSSLNAGIIIVGEDMLKYVPAFMIVMLTGAACVSCSASRASFGVAVSE